MTKVNFSRTLKNGHPETLTIDTNLGVVTHHNGVEQTEQQQQDSKALVIQMAENGMLLMSVSTEDTDTEKVPFILANQ